jgi:hypothetical protein
MPPQSSVSKKNLSNEQREAGSKHLSLCYLLHVGFLLGLFYDTEDGGEMFFRNVCWLSTGYTALYHRR